MLTRGNIVFRICAFDSLISVECTDSVIRDALNAYLFPPLPRTASAPPSPDICLLVERVEDGFRIEIDHNFAEFASTVRDAALAAVKALDDAVVHRMKAFRAVHAGALLIDGKALLLPGSSHAGKSSLAAELLRRGASHYSDEFALIDDLGLVHSYPRPLLLRNGSPKQSLVLPEELNAGFATKPAPVGWILALDFEPGASWKIHELSQGEAVLLLLRNTPHEMGKSPEMVDFFLRVAGDAKCFVGKRGEAAEAATRILDLIRHK
jgi:hypothetical protein